MENPDAQHESASGLSWRQKCTILTVVFAILGAAELYIATKIAFQYRRFFEDTLGTLERLPTLGKAALNLAHFQQSVSSYLQAGAIVLVLALWISRGNRVMVVSVFIACVILLLLLLIIIPGIYIPFRQIQDSI